MTAYTEKYLADFHRRSLKNREAIQAAKQVGCFQCCKIFPASEVTEFTENGQSADAWCPKCGIDSIIVDDGVNEFAPELIQALYERYFEVPDGPSIYVTVTSIEEAMEIYFRHHPREE